jgi:quercetin dioxygenase-like cupin family protein
MSTLQRERSAQPRQTGSLAYADWGSAQWIYMVGDWVAIPFGGAVTGGRFEFMLIEAHPGGGPPLHTHPEGEAFVVLDGEFEFTGYVDGILTTRRAGEADAVFVPGGTPHTFKCVSPSGGNCLTCILPAGREQFFREAGAGVTPENRETVIAAPPDLPRIMAAAQRHNLALWDPAQAWAGAGIEFFPAAQGRAETRELAGEVFHVAAQVELPGGGLVVADSTSRPGSGVPLHCHHQPEVFYCREGEYQFGTLDASGAELWFGLPAGSAVYIPPNAPHAFRNPADTVARCLAFFHGTDVRGFFDLGRPVADREAALRAPFTPDMAELGRLMAEAAKFGMKF